MTTTGDHRRALRQLIRGGYTLLRTSRGHHPVLAAPNGGLLVLYMGSKTRGHVAANKAARPGRPHLGTSRGAA